jgi:hypothetical protein
MIDNLVSSKRFCIKYGVCQGNVKSSNLFNIFVNAFIVYLRHLVNGCHLRDYFVDFLFYADNLVCLLSPLIQCLQHMLDTCYGSMAKSGTHI